MKNEDIIYVKILYVVLMMESLDGLIWTWYYLVWHMRLGNKLSQLLHKLLM